MNDYHLHLAHRYMDGLHHRVYSLPSSSPQEVRNFSDKLRAAAALYNVKDLHIKQEKKYLHIKTDKPANLLYPYTPWVIDQQPHVIPTDPYSLRTAKRRLLDLAHDNGLDIVVRYLVKTKELQFCTYNGITDMRTEAEILPIERDYKRRSPKVSENWCEPCQRELTPFEQAIPEGYNRPDYHTDKGQILHRKKG